MMARFPLRLLPDRLAVARLAPHEPVPAWAWAGGALASVTRTSDELSIVCGEAGVPATVRHESGWRAFALVGPVPFTTTGVISGLTAPLAAVGVGVFVLSTFDTDYLLVKGENVERATRELRAAGFDVR